MKANKTSVHQNTITKDEIIQFRAVRPLDYHCKCEYCSGYFAGEMFNIESGKYYSNRAKSNYLPKISNPSMKHNNPGQFVGYRWAIQNLSEEGDLIFDPTVGTGTAIFEAENNNRKGIGIELEFPDTTRFLCEGRGTIIEGNALEVNPEDFLEKESIQILINGTPYPVISGNTSSDAYFTIDPTKYYGDYKNSKNIGKWKVEEYAVRIHELYTKFVPYIKTGGYLIIIIKDPTQNKQPFNLHKMIIDSILKNNDNLFYKGYFVHAHIPKTLFMSSYQTMYGIVPPLYQTGIILEKK